MPVPVGRGVYRGSSNSQRTIDIGHYRAERPQSSLGVTGKQGRIKSMIIFINLFSRKNKLFTYHSSSK